MILENFNTQQLDQFIFEELQCHRLHIKQSHFFDQGNMKDIEFHQVKSVQAILSPFGTGTILLDRLNLGYIVHNVLVLLACNEKSVEITLHFAEDELFGDDHSAVILNIQNILSFAIALKMKFEIPNIKIGYEPAQDEDCCLVEIIEDEIDLEQMTELMLRNPYAS